MTKPQRETTVRRRDDLITLLMSTWLMIGLFVDGWAHTNLPGLETFFTPWHGIFYSGFVATAAWMVWLVFRNKRAGRTFFQAIPRGYGLGLLGLGIFGLGGVGDMVWHIIFGIEQGIEALFSPTHLLLFVGGTLILSSPLRAAWSAPHVQTAPSFGSLFPALMSITLTTLIVVFMNHGGWGFAMSIPFEPAGVETQRVTGAASQIYITTFILMAPLFLLIRRWHLPFGAISFLITVNSLFVGALFAFRSYPMTIVAPVAGAVVADLLAAVLRPSPSRPIALRTFAVVVPLVTWGLFFLTGDLTHGLVWTPDLWVGAVVAAALGSLTLSVLMVPALPTASAKGQPLASEA